LTSAADNFPVNVCFIAPKAYALFHPELKEVFGGAGVDLYFLATELAKDKNFEVSFIAADYGQPVVEIVESVRVIKSVDFKKNPLIGAIRIWQGLRRANADIYMLKTASPGVLLVAFFCWLHRRNFVYRTAHQIECDGTYLKQHFVLGRFFRWALRIAKLVLVQNKTDQEDLKRTTGVDSIAIPNGHRLAQLKENERDIILWVGRSAIFKRPELFIKLAQGIPTEQFIMICQRAADDEKYEELIAQAETLDNFEFIKGVPFSDTEGFFRRAKVFVNTSDAEGFPNTFIHACMASTPILSLNVNPDGFLQRHNCGICCNDDFKCLVDSLKFILAGNRSIELGKKARCYVEQNHDVKKIVEEYKKLFYKLC
jgi:glycosyltransferase involved in cell wall biosynthesis